MVNAQRLGNTIVVNWNGKLYNKSFPSIEQREEIWEFLANASEIDDEDKVKFKLYFQTVQTESEKQMQLEFEKKKEESKKMEDILDFIRNVRDNGHEIFEVIENSLYVKGIKISTPELLIREIMKANGNTDLDANPERLQALLNFWKLCALNPDPRARFDLFKFLVNHNLTLTPSGNFVAYRTVDKFKSGNEELEKFVTQEWLKIKRWKKSPINYYVFQIEDGSYVSLHGDKPAPEDEIEDIGNLDELYNNIGETSGNIYTDNYTRSFRIKIGELVEMEREKVNPDPELSCESGLHCGNEEFMRANMGYFGKVGIVVLINPKDVTSVPKHDTGKMRTCKYLPIAIAETDENGHIVPVDVDVFDLEMAQNTQEELEKMAELSSTELEEYKKHEFIAPEVDFQMLDNIYESVTISINDANNKIKDRVIKV